jgi:hypothetical protein
MIWVLLITLYSYKGAGYIHTEEFKTKEQCVSFGNSYTESMHKSLSDDHVKVKTLCIQKEETK